MLYERNHIIVSNALQPILQQQELNRQADTVVIACLQKIQQFKKIK